MPIGLICPALGDIYGLFNTVVGRINQEKWDSFLRLYTSLNEESFKKYLTANGISYEFNENNTTDYTFLDTEGQQALSVTQFTNGENRPLKGDEKLAAFDAMKGNIKAFLEKNPGLSLEQVKGIFDSAVMSADRSWGFGKNEFRYEGRGSNYKDLYNAESVVMNEGMVLGVFTRASTLPDDSQYATVNQGIYDYQVGRHHEGREKTEIGQAPPTYIDKNGVERYHSYKDGEGKEKLIDSWTKGAYKALRIQGTVPATRNGNPGVDSNLKWRKIR